MVTCTCMQLLFEDEDQLFINQLKLLDFNYFYQKIITNYSTQQNVGEVVTMISLAICNVQIDHFVFTTHSFFHTGALRKQLPQAGALCKPKQKKPLGPGYHTD